MSPQRVLRLPGGNKVTFLQTAAETRGALLEFEAVVPPHAAGPPAHVHLREQEQITILDGQLDIRFGKSWSRARPGDELVVPPGTAHAVANRTPYPVTFRVRLTPAGNLEQLLRVGAASKWPSLLRIAEVNHGANATLFLAAVPILPQRLALTGLAGVSRLRRRRR